MRTIRASDYRVMPWKNGGGTTTEIAVHPAGAGMESFDWRVSMAHVGQDGPFSAFPGIERTLSVLSGAGLTLAFDDGAAVRLDGDCAPFAFAADRPVTGRLVAGPIDDLNVMTRRGRWRHAVERLGGPGPHRLTGAAVLVAVARRGDWSVGGAALKAGDSAVLDEAPDLTLTADGAEALLFAIRLEPAA